MTVAFILQSAALAAFFGVGVMYVGTAIEEWADGYPIGVVGAVGMLITGLALSVPAVLIAALYALGAL